MFKLGFTDTSNIHVLALLTGKVALWSAVLGCVIILIYQIYTDTKVHQATVKNASPLPPPVETQHPMIKLDQVHLFGVASQAITAPDVTEIPETRLKLELKGAFSSSLPGQASALIAEKGKRAKRFHITDTLPGGATLSDIKSDFVTLSRGGELEILRFPKPVGATPYTSASSATSTFTPETEANVSNITSPDIRVEPIKERLLRLRQNQNL